jgi:hypothetical protein
VIVGLNGFCSLVKASSECAEAVWGIAGRESGVVASGCAPALLFARGLPKGGPTLKQRSFFQKNAARTPSVQGSPTST